MAFKIKYNPKLSDRENFNLLLVDCGYPSDRVSELKVKQGPVDISETPTGLNASVYIEVPASIASQYSNAHQESFTPEAEGNKVFHHRYKRLTANEHFVSEATVIDSDVEYDHGVDRFGSTTRYIMEALGFSNVLRPEDYGKLTIQGIDNSLVQYGSNKIRVSLSNMLSFKDFSSGSFVLNMSADATSGKRVLLKLSITDLPNPDSFKIPKETYEGTDLAYTSKGNIIQPKVIKLNDLISNEIGLVTDKVKEVMFSDSQGKQQFFSDKYSFTRKGLVPKTAVYPKTVTVENTPNLLNLVKYVSPTDNHPYIAGDVNVYMIPLVDKEVAQYLGGVSDQTNRFRFDRLDTNSNGTFVIFNVVGKYNAVADSNKFSEFVNQALQGSGLVRKPSNGVSYPDSTLTYKVETSIANDMFMSGPVYIALVPPKTEKLTLREDMDGFEAMILRDASSLPEF